MVQKLGGVIFGTHDMLHVQVFQIYHTEQARTLDWGNRAEDDDDDDARDPNCRTYIVNDHADGDGEDQGMRIWRRW